MTLSTVREPGLPATDYYAPAYRILVEGQELEPEVIGDVLDVKVVMDMDNMTSFEFNVSNWDDEHLEFKYSDTTTFDIGKVVEVQMGYADRLVSMVLGQVATLSPKFPDSGSPTLAVTGLDGMLKLADRQPKEGESRKYENKADWQIAQEVAARNGLGSFVTQEGEVHAIVVQKNQNDARFLKERAARSDRDCFVLTDPETGKATLYFVKPLDGRDSGRTRVYVFEWGASLIKFDVALTIRNQVSKVTVRGWDSRTKQAIVESASPADLPGASGGGNSGPKLAETTLNGKQDVVVDAPVLTRQEAKDLALSLLTERAYDFITGNGTVIGLPDLRPGDNVELTGLGVRFSGQYYVKRVEHIFNSSGYLSSFEVRRVFDGGTK